MNRGMTLIEAVIGMACIVLLVTVLVGLFAAGVKSFTYTTRESNVLLNIRQAYEGAGSAHGALWASRNASSFQDLSATALDLNSASGSSVQYTLSNGNLSLTKSGSVTTLANTITSMQTTYYTLDALGHISISTSAASAIFVTVAIKSQSTGQPSYSFYSGARLRNHS